MNWFKVYKVRGEVMHTIGWTTSIDDAKAMCYDEVGTVWRIVMEKTE